METVLLSGVFRAEQNHMHYKHKSEQQHELQKHYFSLGVHLTPPKKQLFKQFVV